MILRSFYLCLVRKIIIGLSQEIPPFFVFFGFVVNGRCNAIGCTFFGLAPGCSGIYRNNVTLHLMFQ